MRYKNKIRKGDLVKVISGDDKGRTGNVIKVIPKSQKLLVQGVNLVIKHKKSQNGTGEIVRQESPIHLSNVSFFDSELNIATKIKVDLQNGKKVRIGKKTDKSY
jgi:large subunit ribosomal protein L24